MKKYLRLIILLIVCSLAVNVAVNGQSCTPTAVTKTNSLKVYVHWMPWFFAPTNPGTGPTGYSTNVNSQGSWGQHWCSDGSGGNPNTLSTITDYTGASVQARNIDAHFHPLIGPYDESDPNVLEYHLLLMKYSGIDGVIIDWYGSGNANSNVGDASANQVNSAAMINDVGNYGLKYALAVEDASMSNLGANLSYAASNYFGSSNYIKLGDMRGGAAPNATAPLALDFEPFSNTNTGTWNTMGNTKALLTYYGQSWNTIPSVAGGEFMWPWPQGGQGIVNGVQAWYNDINTYYNGSFYTGGAPNVRNNSRSNGVNIFDNVVLGIAFPGFFDFYRGDASSYTDPNAGCCDQYGIIPRNYMGNTLSTTLNLAKANQAVIDGIQVATWNDFSEGTVVEPTVEYGFSSLTTIQQFTGVPYTTHNLTEIYKLFTLRKTYSGNTTIQNALNTASCDYAALDTAGAQAIIDCIATTGGTSCSVPSITSSTSASDSAGFSFSYTITASNSPTSYSATGLPAGLTINTSTGVISGTPTGTGTSSITINAINANGTGTATLTLTVTCGSPIQYTVTGGGAYCSGGSGVAINLSKSQTGLNYQLLNGASNVGSAVAGTGSALSFGNQTAAGTYTVKAINAIATGCTSTMSGSVTVTITTPPSATISYAGSPFCKSLGTTQAVTQTGTAGGTYSSTAGLTINGGTGAITPSSSTAGTYTVTYTMAASGGCALQTATTSVTITTLPSATITYAGSPFCTSLGAQSVTQTGTAGGTYSSAAGLTINAGTGAITPSSSTAGTYTVTYTMAATGGCTLQTATTSITITGVPSATISYAGTPFCKSLGTAQSVTQTGTGGGTYSSTAGLTINAGTGAITPSSSTAGTYTVTYTIAAAAGCAIVTATTSIIITTVPTATISYAGSPFCTSLGAQTVSLTGTAGGTYSSTAGLTINAGSGTITPSSSTTGTYTVTYTMAAAAGGCTAQTATTTVTITALPTATISYAGTPFCKSLGAAQSVTQSGTAGGTYSSTAGLTINAGTGAITPSSSTAGTYTVTYTVTGCTVATATTSVIITALPTATISYPGSPYCTSAVGAQAVTLTGTGSGGTYSSSAGGLTINVATGAITPSSSTAGTYTVTYTIAAAAGCAVVTATTSVIITALPTATISYAGTPFCKSLGVAQAVTQTGTGSGGTYSSAGGLTINAATGAITPSSSTAGTYTVTYTIAAAAGCAVVTATTSVIITAVPSATISYAGSPYCTSVVGAQAVTLTGTGGGSYASAPAGLTINAASGAVTPSSSTAGTYTVTYTMAAAGGCALQTATTTVTISSLQSPVISCGASTTTSVGFNWTAIGGATNYNISYIITPPGGPAGAPISGGSIVPTTYTASGGTIAAADTVTLTVTPTGAGCFASQSHQCLAISCPVLSATITYAGPFCSNDPAAKTVTQTGTGGGTYSSTAGLTINAANGTITPSTSTAGTYTITYTMLAIGGCPNQTTTTTVTITPLPAATISYAGAPFCSNDVAVKSVTLTGTGGGAYSSAAGLSINAASGAITPSTSTAGTYTVTYTMAATGGCTVQTATTSVVITALPAATITYAGTPFCKSLAVPQPVTLTGTAGGTYSSAGGLTINAATGAITPSTSTAGTYTVTYTMAATGGCSIQTATTSVIINAIQTPVISCGGSTASTVGFNWGAVTGATAYTITYQVNPPGAVQSGGSIAASTYTATGLSAGDVVAITVTPTGSGCLASQTQSCTANNCLPLSATINYTGPFCSTDATAEPVTFTGSAGGTYSSTAGLTIDATTGAITPSTSTAGTYTVTYTMIATGGCPNQTATTSVTITALPTATINYGGSPYCANDAVVETVTQTGTVGGAYSSAPGLTLDGTNGSITPLTSTPATYTVTYTMSATGGCTVQTSTTSVTVNPVLSPVITCGGSTSSTVSFNWNTIAGAIGYNISYIVNPPGTPVNIGSIAATTYTVTGLSPADIVSINVTPTGTGCFAPQTQSCTANNCPALSATINYTGPFCSTDVTAEPVTQTGTTGGTYSSTTGLIIDPVTGAITPSTSTAGTYTVTYTMLATGGCPNQTATTSVTITALPTATINYGGSPYCANDLAVEAVTQTGTTGGTYSSAAGLTIDATTGAITPSTSILGTYNITYTMAAAGGCAVQTATTSIIINPTLSPVISCAGSTTSTVNFDWSPGVTGATGYTITYEVNPPGVVQNGGSTTATNYSVNGLTPGDIVAITVTPTGAGCFAAQTQSCVASNCPALSAAINYAGSPFCSGDITAEPVTQTGTTGGTYSSTTGLTIDPVTGAITPSTSTPGTYTVIYTMIAGGTCPDQTTSTSITITALPTATINYSGSPFCASDATAEPVTLTGTANGNYSSAAGLTIDAVTGAITPSTSTTGTYTVTYTIAATSGCTVQTATTSVSIATSPSATISYAGSPFCSGDATAEPVTQTGTGGGTYSATGGLSINTITGAITPSTSTAGTYTITYAIAATGGCTAQTATTSITINALAAATISYTGTPFCASDATAEQVTLTGTANGNYSSTAGLTINTTTGAITPSSSTAGIYTITYTMAAASGCTAQTATTSVSITSLPSATISYAGSPFCVSDVIAEPVTQTGTAGGNYSSTAGLTINAATGAITPSSSTAGTYTITYTMAATGGCTAQTATTSLTITALPSATIHYAGPFCSNDATAEPVILVGTNGGTYSSMAGLSLNTSTGAITPSTSTPSTYTVTYMMAATGGCTVQTATTSLTLINPPTVTVRDTAVTLVSHSYVQLSGNVTPTLGVTYFWSPSTDISNINIPDPVVNPTATITYTLTAYPIALTSCNASATVRVIVLDPVQPANIFSPNGDWNHDTWIIDHIELYPKAEIDVFNRYGQFMFQSEGDYAKKPWDGTNNGAPLPVGAYYYIIKLNSGHVEIDKPLTGCVSIVR